MSKKIIAALIILAVSTGLSIFLYKKIEAAFGPPFGGFILNTFYCNCSNTFLLTVSPPVGGQFIYVPGTPQYMHYRLPSAGVWVLGLYSPGTGVCLIYVGKGCSPFGAPSGTITPTVGTSL